MLSPDKTSPSIVYFSPKCKLRKGEKTILDMCLEQSRQNCVVAPEQNSHETASQTKRQSH